MVEFVFWLKLCLPHLLVAFWLTSGAGLPLFNPHSSPFKTGGMSVNISSLDVFPGEGFGEGGGWVPAARHKQEYC